MCNIDWKLIFDLLKSLSILIASIVAIYGINSWRREARWKSRYKLAEEVLSLFYEVQECISIIRNPMSSSNEGTTRKREENERPEDSGILDSAYVTIERFNNNSEAFYKLRAIKYRFVAVFGKKNQEPFDSIIKVTNNIMMASNFLGRNHWKNQGKHHLRNEQHSQNLKLMHKYEAMIWEKHYEKDEIKEEIENIIRRIEHICKPILSKNTFK